jgi:hypothetical protein
MLCRRKVSILVVTLLLFPIAAQAFIESTVFYDIAWKTVPGDLTTWGTPFVPAHPWSDGMFEYSLHNSSNSTGSISHFQVYFDWWDPTYNPNGRFLGGSIHAIDSAPWGWTSSYDWWEGTSMISYHATAGYELDPGAVLPGFLINFQVAPHLRLSYGIHIYSQSFANSESDFGHMDYGVTTPVPEPNPFVLLMLGAALALAVAVLRSRGKKHSLL